jgi:hypothetical protein
LDNPKLLIAAYREGLGLAAVTLVKDERGARLITAAPGASPQPGEVVQTRWWCKSTHQAQSLVERVARALRTARPDDAEAVSRWRRAVSDTARRLGIMLRSDEEIAREAAAVIARLEAEMAAQQRAGTLKSVNRGYRDYRLEASARGEKVLRYADWMARYKARLVREIAANLRAL